jgi:hypothetical protein
MLRVIVASLTLYDALPFSVYNRYAGLGESSSSGR